MAVPSRGGLSDICSLKILVALLAGFYLGGLHSSVYLVNQQDENSAAAASLRHGVVSAPIPIPIPTVPSNTVPPHTVPHIALPDAVPSNTEPHATVPRPSKNPLCRRFPYLAKESALSLWLDHTPLIHKSSQLLENDKRYDYHDFTAQLLEVVSPRLSRSVLNLPLHWTVVDRIMQKIDARYQFLQEGGEEAPPVKIVVMGGSILVGRNCRKLNKDLGISFTLPNRQCTYAHRLQKFLDLVGGTTEVFHVTKIAMGGTNTAVGSQIFYYDLLPREGHNPDIVINAYATNDMHVLTLLEAQSGNQTLGQRVFEMTQEFVRDVMQEQPCRDKPLLIHMDDYLGNEQREILSTMELSQAAGALADYYGFSRVSYANVVRDIVYGDTKEFWFSPEGWWPKGAEGMEREIHPGMGMHIVSQWIISYNLLTMAATYCSMEGFWRKPFAKDYGESALSEILPLRGDYSIIPGKPKSPPDGLPPKLTPSLNLETISTLWQAAKSPRDFEGSQCDSTDQSRCIFSWVAGLSLMQNNVTWITETFGARTTESRGWKLVDENGKLGFMPEGLGDKVVLRFSDIPQPIGSVTFFILKSYGPKWDKSQLSVTLAEMNQANEWQDVMKGDLSGIHAKNTSELYPETVNLPNPIHAGSSLQVTYELTGGTTFKIMGLAVCS